MEKKKLSLWAKIGIGILILCAFSVVVYLISYMIDPEGTEQRAKEYEAQQAAEEQAKVQAAADRQAQKDAEKAAKDAQREAEYYSNTVEGMPLDELKINQLGLMQSYNDKIVNKIDDTGTESKDIKKFKNKMEDIQLTCTTYAEQLNSRADKDNPLVQDLAQAWTSLGMMAGYAGDALYNQDPDAVSMMEQFRDSYMEHKRAAEAAEV